MYESCGPEYYDIFMKQFMQTLGQLGAAVVTSTLAVPVYSYYTRNLVSKKRDTVNEVYSTENEFNKNLNESENITEKDVTDDDEEKSHDESDDIDNTD